MRGVGASIALGLVVALAGFWYLQREPAAPDRGPSGDPGVKLVDDGASLVPATTVDSGAAPDAGTQRTEVATSSTLERVGQDLMLELTGSDPVAADAGRALLSVYVFEGEARTPLPNHPVRVEPIIFRVGAPVLAEVRTDSSGRVEVSVPAGEGLKVLVFEEFRNVPVFERQMLPLEPGSVGRLEVAVPLPPLASMAGIVVSKETGEPVPGARIWIEKLLRIDGEPVVEIYVEERTDRRGRFVLTWPAVPSLGGRAEKEGVGEARFVPVDGRGSEGEPFLVRLGELLQRGDRSTGNR